MVLSIIFRNQGTVDSLGAGFYYPNRHRGYPGGLCTVGAKRVERFNGMWAFAIVDEQRQKLFLSRDRFGIKPLYHYLDNSRFVFASEIKSFRDFLPKLSLHSTCCLEYLAYGWQDHTEATLFEGIRHFPPAHTGTYCLQTGAFQTTSYYQMPERTWV
ncbi:MAG: hypothetical protein R2795_16295 [Saprospiraceae bacterium]